MFNLFNGRGRQLAQHPPSRPHMAVLTLHPAQKLELDARIGFLEKRLAEESARRLELELGEVELRQALDVSRREKASLLVSVRDSEEERRQLAAKLVTMELQAKGIVDNTANMVRGIFDKVKSEAQRLVLLTFSILVVCSGYFGGKVVYLKDQLVGLSNRGADLKRCGDMMKSEVEALRAKLEEVFIENERLQQENCTAKGWQEKYRDIESVLQAKGKENDDLRQKVEDLERMVEMEAQARVAEMNKATGTMYGKLKSECERVVWFTFSLLVMCINFATRCKEQMASLSRKTTEMREFMNCIRNMNWGIQALRESNNDLSKKVDGLIGENKEYKETIRLMELEIQQCNHQRAQMAAAEAENMKWKGQAKEVKALIGTLVEKNDELNRIVEKGNANMYA